VNLITSHSSQIFSKRIQIQPSRARPAQRQSKKKAWLSLDFLGDILVDKPSASASMPPHRVRDPALASFLNEACFQDEQAAFDELERIVWPTGPVCPHCGCTGRINALRGVRDKVGRDRIGLKKCYDCRKQFTVRVGPVFEKSHVPLHLWLQASYLLCSSKKGISSNQLSRTLGVTLKSAWFMSHRLREAMRTGALAPMGGEGKIVEVDETFIGRKEGVPKAKAAHWHKNAVLTLIERGGKARSFHVETITKDEICSA
jgi:transposase-like protein